MDKIQTEMEASRKLAGEILKLISGHKASEAYISVCIVLAALVNSDDVTIEHVRVIANNVEKMTQCVVLEREPKK